MIPALDAMVQKMCIGTEAQCRAWLPLEGADPLSKFSNVPAILRAELLSVSHPNYNGPAAASQRIKTFDPPLSLQR